MRARAGNLRQHVLIGMSTSRYFACERYGGGLRSILGKRDKAGLRHPPPHDGSPSVLFEGNTKSIRFGVLEILCSAPCKHHKNFVHHGISFMLRHQSAYIGQAGGYYDTHGWLTAPGSIAVTTRGWHCVVIRWKNWKSETAPGADQ